MGRRTGDQHLHHRNVRSTTSLLSIIVKSIICVSITILTLYMYLIHTTYGSGFGQQQHLNLRDLFSSNKYNTDNASGDINVVALLETPLVSSQLQTSSIITHNKDDTTAATVAEKQQVKNQKKSTNTKKDCKNVIVLQQSPVKPKLQYERLLNIDHSWGQWAKQSPTTCIVGILSLCPISGTDGFQATTNITFKHLDVIFLSQHSTVCTSDGAPSTISNKKPHHHQEESNSAYRNLAETILQLTFKYTQTEYFTFANDHSFFIIPLYDQYITTSMNHHLPLRYTGNHLSILRGGKVVHFASGGAGITVSKDILHVMNYMWTLKGQSQYLTQALQYLMNIYYKGKGESEVERMLRQSNIMDMEPPNFPAIMNYLQHCHANCSLTLKLPRQSSLTIYCHEQRKKSTMLYHLDDTKTNSTGITFDRVKEDAYCIAHDKWSRDNPGIILVNCLQKLLEMRYQDSYSHNIYKVYASASSQSSPSSSTDLSNKPCSREDVMGEVFNVYGPLRLIKRNYDEWYLRHKVDLNIDVMGYCPEDSPQQDTISPTLRMYHKYAMAQDTVSFHYVDRNEAKLLYQYLSSSSSSSSTVEMEEEEDSGNNKEKILPSGLLSAENLLQEWPHTPETIGPYAIKLTSKNDAEKLLQYLVFLRNRVASCPDV